MLFTASMFFTPARERMELQSKLTLRSFHPCDVIGTEDRVHMGGEENVQVELELQWGSFKILPIHYEDLLKHAVDNSQQRQSIFNRLKVAVDPQSASELTGSCREALLAHLGSGGSSLRDLLIKVSDGHQHRVWQALSFIAVAESITYLQLDFHLDN
jgi:hypothetical protein